MSTTITRSVRLDLPLAAVADLLRTPEHAVRRLEAAGREDPVLVRFAGSGDGVRIETRYFGRRDELPGWMASRFPQHGPENHRTEVWTLGPATLTAVVVVESVEGRGGVRGTYTVVPEGEGCRWELAAEVSVPLPVIGRRVEKVVAATAARVHAGEAAAMTAGAVRIR
ncbi:DUF2505 domain-containing protein [Phycicoccus flavus]|uniref:DUF2505 domain-containing protein n=1 Tax=Phycicoccus flavus TaxID=2502783 RepID=A0A8T6R255_9MICO|nr:DUF2505 domain-containing protein [Phycicoccus flavus]NHA67704.1 DUF2505 domain-containing protein [Phycicoccus flavus]